MIFAVAEAASMELNRSLICGGGHALGMVNLLSGAIRGGTANIIAIACGGITVFDLDVHHHDISVHMLKSATSMMDLDMFRGFLVLVGGKATSFLEAVHSVLEKCRQEWTETGMKTGGHCGACC